MMITDFVSGSFEKLKQQVEKDCRVRVLVSRLEIGGYCAACQGAQLSGTQNYSSQICIEVPTTGATICTCSAVSGLDAGFRLPQNTPSGRKYRILRGNKNLRGGLGLVALVKQPARRIR
jgi:hypothetical protein